MNPAAQAEPPAPPHPDPQPPTPEDAARIINEAWRDPDWGAIVWLAMTTGARRRRAVRFALAARRPGQRRTYRRSAYVDEHGELREKDTKTHQQRRVALDAETMVVLRELFELYLARLGALGLRHRPDAHVFSPEPDHSRGFRLDSVTQL